MGMELSEPLVSEERERRRNVDGTLVLRMNFLLHLKVKFKN